MSEQFIVSLITFVIMSFGTLANLFVFLAAGKMGSMNSSFGIITKNQAICNMVMCLIFLLYVCPMQLSNSQPLVNYSRFLGLSAMTVYEVSNQLHLLLALNRLCAVFWTFHYDQIFNKFNTNLMKNVACLIAITMCIGFYEVLGCHFSYNDISWTFVFLNTQNCSTITWYSDFILNISMVALTLIINLLTAYKAGKDSRNLLSSVGVQMSKEQKQRENSFIRQSFFQGASIFAGQVTYYVTAPLVSNSILLFLDASLWAFMHAVEGGIILASNKEMISVVKKKRRRINCIGVRVDVLETANDVGIT
ncbi:hypothetical protein GCK72_019520 [Caenorhabditis remanei]|uniref:7TM GPCR serpentine receptor class x (Srx) domain-containing protein n=1 Tax=Caenorhabditis remanei TaxID=31234 RepID=A0A6A5GE64_CAERE|nr:hypothetical protein GCK72_019520 [Caenorhabditis remanei]KAF1752965.1 hypothetical protein GCK72_019520 [Caenorhabditis remanei]